MIVLEFITFINYCDIAREIINEYPKVRDGDNRLTFGVSYYRPVDLVNECEYIIYKIVKYEFEFDFSDTKTVSSDDDIFIMENRHIYPSS